MVTYAGDIRVHVAREFMRLLEVEPCMKTLVGMVKCPFCASRVSVCILYDRMMRVWE